MKPIETWGQKVRGIAPQSDEVDAFVAHLGANGWKRVGMTPEFVEFAKVLSVPNGGNVTYYVLLDAFGAAKWTSRETGNNAIVWLSGPRMKLIPPKVIPKEKLADWKTLPGAQAGVMKQLDAEYKKFLENTKKARERRIRKDMKK